MHVASSYDAGRARWIQPVSAPSGRHVLVRFLGGGWLAARSVHSIWCSCSDYEYGYRYKLIVDASTIRVPYASWADVRTQTRARTTKECD
eukprot:scaffold118816_cov45-Prasinocladus_malaysianus.AAC.1